jgi:glycosidase
VIRAWLLALLVSTLVACSELPQTVAFDGPLVISDAGLPDAAFATDADLGDLGADADAAVPGAFDWRDGIMYFVLLDRFFDGDSALNAPVSGAEKPADFQGGDLAGLLVKLKSGYFTSLGVNVLWLSSPAVAPSTKHLGQDGHYHTGYHGYWPAELDKVEPQLGTMVLLQQVVAEAHKQKIRVVLDYVMNHVHSSSSTYSANKSWFWPLDLGGGKQCICGKGCSWSPPEGLRCWFDPFLPTFDFTQAAARKFSVDNALWWIKQAGVDGFRLDAVKHIEADWLTDLRKGVDAQAKPGERFYLVGETFDGSKDLLKQYIDPKTKLDGQFDFPLRAMLVKVLLMRQGSFTDLETFLNANAGYYGPGAVMGTFLGNHDLPRAIHLAEDTPQFSEWNTGKSRAWSNTPSLPTGDKPFERLALGFTALLTLPGLPLIYYGDEIGMPGGGDPDNRRLMTWSGTTAAQDKLRAHVTKLTAIRAQHPALRRGVRKQLWISADVYAYQMSSATGTIVVVLNRSDSEKTISLSAASATSYKDLLSGATFSAASVKVPARTSLVLGDGAK